MPPGSAKRCGFFVYFVGRKGLEAMELNGGADAGEACSDDDYRRVGKVRHYRHCRGVRQSETGDGDRSPARRTANQVKY